LGKDSTSAEQLDNDLAAFLAAATRLSDDFGPHVTPQSWFSKDDPTFGEFQSLLELLLVLFLTPGPRLRLDYTFQASMFARKGCDNTWHKHFDVSGEPTGVVPGVYIKLIKDYSKSISFLRKARCPAE